MKLDEILDLSSIDKAQLVQLCNALYELLQQRPAVNPYFTFVPQQPLPYVPPVIPYVPGFPDGTTVCANNSEATHQKYFGVK
jgi:hypothetical protein